MKTRFAPAFIVGLSLLATSSVKAVQVTFQVNTSIQSALGNFDPTTDTVFVAGDAINAWSATASELTRSESDPAVWAGTFDVTGNEGDTVQYKFLLTTAAGTRWEGSVGPSGPDGNRTFTLAATDQVLPVVYFNNLTNTGISAQVTFQLDLSVQVEAGNFDPSSGTVTVAGEFNNWSTTATPMTNNPAEPNLWKATVNLSGAENSTVNYKFVLNGGTWEGNVGPNGAQNRVLTLTAADQALPVAFFNNAGAAPAVIPLTFQVNMGVQIAQGKFDPASGSVSVAGDPLNGWSPTASALTRNATNALVWEGTFEVTASAGSTLLYKFVANEATWETGDNRTYTMTSTNAQTVPVVFFDRADNLGGLSVKLANGQSTLTWTAGPQVRLQKASNVSEGPWQDVPNTLGQSSIALPVETAPAFFRLIGR